VGKLRAFIKSTGLAGLLTLLVIFLLQLTQSQSLSVLGNLVFDSFARAQPREYVSAPVVVVDIDEESLRREGQWPWPRQNVARMLQRLNEAGAAAIGLDIVFSEADRTSPRLIASTLASQGVAGSTVDALRALPDNDDEFAAALVQMPVVNGFFLTHDPKRSEAVPKAGIAISGSVHVESIPEYSNAILPLPQLDEAALGRGFLTLTGDSDGIVRRAPLLARQGDQILPALSVETLRVAQGAGSILVKMSDGSGNIAAGAEPGVVSLKVGDFEIPTTRAGELWMHYTEPVASRTVPAWQVLDPATADQELAERFEGRIVLVGAGAIGLRDLVSTPIRERELGVMVHAQAIEQMILGDFLTRPDWAVGLERALVLLAGALLLLLLPRLGASGGAILGFAMIAAVSAGSWWAFSEQQFLLDPTFPILAVLGVYGTVTVLDYYREEKARAYIHQAFDRYLSPELVKRIAADPHQLDLGGEEREMTVLFCDIRSFSRISEQLEPRSLISFLISFLTPMCDILLERKATIDKFIGDAILAFWNAPLDDPDQYANAARAALAMRERLKALNWEMPHQPGQVWPGEVAIGIGLNSGSCCVGNMGSAQRLSYSLLGDTVNLASRIEGLTKLYKVDIAVGSALQKQLPKFATVELDLVRVVGRETPEAIFALIGDEELGSSEDFRAFALGHSAMLAAYRAMDWDTAQRLLDEWGAQADNFGLDGLYAIYRARASQLRRSPPPGDWDGVYNASEK